jgi:hypothetical protein
MLGYRAEREEEVDILDSEHRTMDENSSRYQRRHHESRLRYKDAKAKKRLGIETEQLESTPLPLDSEDSIPPPRPKRLNLSGKERNQISWMEGRISGDEGEILTGVLVGLQISDIREDMRLMAPKGALWG